MIDTHSHIYEPEFADDVHDVVARAAAVGVQQVYLPNINEQSIQPMLALCRQYPGRLFPMLGLHPEDVKDDYIAVLDRMETLLGAESFIANGEIGLDFYWDKTYATQQVAAFERQIGWAARRHLPLMIHTRAAHRELVDALHRCGGEQLTGVFHCFGGTSDEAAELLRFPGFCIGIGGVLTFKKSTLPQVLKDTVPLERIVLETDAPYLAPVPHRGQRNEPSFLPAVAARLAEVFGVPVDDVVRQTSLNARRVFHT